MDPKHFTRILAPTDFSDPSNEAIETAISFAQISAGTLDLVHVARETPAYRFCGSAARQRRGARACLRASRGCRDARS